MVKLTRQMGLEHQGEAEHHQRSDGGIRHLGRDGGGIHHLDRGGDHQGDEPRDSRHTLGEGV